MQKSHSEQVGQSAVFPCWRKLHELFSGDFPFSQMFCNRLQPQMQLFWGGFSLAKSSSGWCIPNPSSFALGIQQWLVSYSFCPSPRKSILRSTSPFPTALPSSPLNTAACCAAFGSGKSDGIETSRAVAWRWTRPLGGDTPKGALTVGYRKWPDGEHTHSKWWFSTLC